MAKATVKKKSTAAPAKKAASTGSKAKATLAVDKVCEQVLERLQALDIEHQLQADLAWCLGSYRHDNNPIGLLQNGAKALEVFAAVNEKKAKSVPAKLISDLQKVLK